MVTKSSLMQLFPRARGCYIIRDSGRVLYVGQSKNMRKRWIEHHLRNLIEENFPRATVEIVLWSGDLLQKEAELIRELRPSFNDKDRRQIMQENNLKTRLSAEDEERLVRLFGRHWVDSR